MMFIEGLMKVQIIIMSISKVGAAFFYKSLLVFITVKQGDKMRLLQKEISLKN